MVIPHGQDRMFSLQLNLSMIAFLAGTVLLAVGLSAYGVYHNRLRAREVERLHALYGSNFRAAIDLQQRTELLLDENRELRENMLSIAEQLGVPTGELEIIPDMDVAASGAERALERELIRHRQEVGFQTSYLPPVQLLRTATRTLIGDAPLLLFLTESLGEGIGVYAKLPIGRPFRSMNGLHDTSGYGERYSPFGGYVREFHPGYDTSGPYGTPVYATGEGSVVYYSGGGYGRALLVKHDFGFYSMYAHLASIEVQPGTHVRRGQLLGTMGSSGLSTGPHLHYEIRIGELQHMDPKPYVCATDFESSACLSENRPSVF